MSDITIGEALSRRKLKTEPYGTRTIYSSGQDYAVRLGPDDSLVSWVDPSGGLCVLPCEKVNNEWFHRRLMIYCSVDRAECRDIHRSFVLLPNMLRAIEDAMTRKVTRRPADKPSDGS